MKNTLADLNNHLFAQIERLGDESLKGEELMQEIHRADAITDVATQIISNASLVLKACQYKDEKWDADATVPKMLQGGE